MRQLHRRPHREKALLAATPRMRLEVHPHKVLCQSLPRRRHPTKPPLLQSARSVIRLMTSPSRCAATCILSVAKNSVQEQEKQQQAARVLGWDRAHNLQHERSFMYQRHLAISCAVVLRGPIDAWASCIAALLV